MECLIKIAWYPVRTLGKNLLTIHLESKVFTDLNSADTDLFIQGLPISLYTYII